MGSLGFRDLTAETKKRHDRGTLTFLDIAFNVLRLRYQAFGELGALTFRYVAMTSIRILEKLHILYLRLRIREDIIMTCM